VIVSTLKLKPGDFFIRNKKAQKNYNICLVSTVRRNTWDSWAYLGDNDVCLVVHRINDALFGDEVIGVFAYNEFWTMESSRFFFVNRLGTTRKRGKIL
jgi:hypothetical protein